MSEDATGHDTPVPRPVWFLDAEELAATRAKLAVVQARAVRKGFTGRIELEAVPASHTQHTPGGLEVTVHGFDVTITGEPPRYQGWRFVAAVDAVDGGGVVLRYPPGAQASVANDQLRPGQCDHCHTKRDRRSTVLVAHDDTGQLLQVGRSCLKDFLGHNVSPVFLTADEVRDDLGRDLTGSPRAWDTPSVLAYAWAAVQAFGWTPASDVGSGRTPTRDVVRVALAGGRGADDVHRALASHLHQAQTVAPQLRATLLAGLSGTEGYEANLTAVLRGDAVEARHLGLAVSAIPAHDRLVGQRRLEASRQQQAAVLEHVGAVGDKVTLSGTVRTALRVDGYTYRSPAQVMLVLDCGTALAKMTTTAGWAYQVKVGDPLTVTGTVKAHTVWNGLNQTVLTRPKQLTPDPAAAPALTGGTAAVWETVAPTRLDGAQTGRRNITPAASERGIAVHR